MPAIPSPGHTQKRTFLHFLRISFAHCIFHQRSQRLRKGFNAVLAQNAINTILKDFINSMVGAKTNGRKADFHCFHQRNPHPFFAARERKDGTL